MNATDVIKYLGNILNIDIKDKLTFTDMIEDLSKIQDLANFRTFMKENFMNEKYRYYTGYQKFLVLKKDYEEKTKFTLTVDQKYQVENYAEKLFKKTCDCFDEIVWLIQTGNDIHSTKINLLIYRYFGDEKSAKDLKVLEKIGKRQELVRLMNHKEILREKIRKAITSFTIKKYAPAIENKSTIQKLKEKTR